MLSYEDFYNYIWCVYLSDTDVSIEYRENNDEFIKMLTFSIYSKYTKKENIHESVYGEMFKAFFSNLFLFSADNFDYC